MAWDDTKVENSGATADGIQTAAEWNAMVADQKTRITASGTVTLTNKTFDANGSGNVLSNVEVADFAAASVVTAAEGIGSNNNDTTLPTSAAVKAYADSVGGGGGSIITSGAVVPSSAPSGVGYIYVDTAQDEAYIATDSSNTLGFERVALAEDVYKKELIDAILLGKLDSLFDDKTPELSGDIRANSYGLVNLGATSFFQEYDNGNSSTSLTLSWLNANHQKVTLTGNCTLTFTAPRGSTSLILKLVQDGTGSRTVTWPASVKWSGGTPPTLTTTASAVDIISFYFDGTNYYGASGTNFS